MTETVSHAVESWPVVFLILGALLIFRDRIWSAAEHAERRNDAQSGSDLRENLAKLQEDANSAAADTEPVSVALRGAVEDQVALYASLAQNTSTRIIPATVSIGASGAGALQGRDTVLVQQIEGSESIVSTVLKEASTDPKVGLIRLSLEIEEQLRIILGRAGYLAGEQYLPLSKALQIIRTQYNVLSPPVVSALDTFSRVRNQIVHGGQGSNDDILSALDSGLMVYETLRQQPFARFYVRDADIDVYSDSAGTRVRDDLKGLVIEEVGAGGLTKTRHLVLSSLSHYQPGMEVAWEWDQSKLIAAPVWRRDPETGNMEGSDEFGPMEFIGRDLAEFRKSA